jgi:phosphatidylserine/phosphatidylglycerophosphate/cardiolipin synthase-like enzyme
MKKKNLFPLIGLKIIFSVTLILAALDIAKLNKFANYVKCPVKYQKIFFSQTDNIPAMLIDLINKEKKSIKAAYYSFTLESVAEALINARDRGVEIELIIDSSNIANKSKAVDKLIKNKLPIYVFNCAAKEFKSLMHHKFIIFEKQEDLPQGGVITGSFNCSRAAAERHWENIVILEGPEAAKEYLNEFYRLAQVCKNQFNN